MKNAQPYKFRIILKDGSAIEGGAESKDLCIAHLRHCLLAGKDIASCWYLGKYARNDRPKEVK